MRKEQLKELIETFQHGGLPEYKTRAVNIPTDVDKIITLIGPRRAGKTSELYNLMHGLLQRGIKKEQICYLNCEDERFQHSAEELDDLLKAYQELYPHLMLSDCYFFFDEIQLFTQWDRYIRRVYDTISKHIFLTGSNAKLLSREIATELRGRSISYPILPLSFKEYCEFLQIDTQRQDQKNKSLLSNALSSFLTYGGFPEVIRFSDVIKIKTLQEYFNVMMYRDLVERFEIKNISLLKFFLKRIFSSATKEFSTHKIYNELKSAGFKLSKDTLYEYAAYCEAIYMVVIVKKYNASIINQELTDKKVYVIDNGLYNALSHKFSQDTGKLMEQAVLHQLMHQETEIFFHKDKYECDFILKEGFDITQAIQVCYDCSDPDTLKREVNGLLEACKTHSLSQGIIITFDTVDEFEQGNISIKLISLQEWLLSF